MGIKLHLTDHLSFQIAVLPNYTEHKWLQLVNYNTLCAIIMLHLLQMMPDRLYIILKKGFYASVTYMAKLFLYCPRFIVFSKANILSVVANCGHRSEPDEIYMGIF